MTIPFTYYLFHKPTGKKYYGVRYKKGCHPDDLWNKYFSSSIKVKKLIEEYGIDSFDYQVRKIFSSSQDARKWESRVLWKLRVTLKDEWLNDNYGMSNPTMIGKTHSEETKIKMSAKQSKENNPMWGKTHTKEVRQRISEANRGKQLSLETKEKISRNNKGKTRTRFISEEEIQRRAKTNRERAHKRTEEQKNKMSEAAKGRKWKKCPETGKRIFYREII